VEPRETRIEEERKTVMAAVAMASEGLMVAFQLPMIQITRLIVLAQWAVVTTTAIQMLMFQIARLFVLAAVFLQLVRLMVLTTAIQIPAVLQEAVA
jgi:hypothetical protein